MNRPGIGRIKADKVLAYRPVEAVDVQWLIELRHLTMSPHLLRQGIEPDRTRYPAEVEKDLEFAQIVLLSNTAIGMVKLNTQVDPWHLRQIQLLPDYQGKGYGRLIVEQRLRDAEQNKRAVVLNVLKVNPAHKLYTALGFRVVDSNEQAYKMLWQPKGMR